MKREMLLALVLFTIYQGSSQTAGSRIGFATPKIPDNLSNLKSPQIPTGNLNALGIKLWQAPAHYVYLEGDKMQAVVADMLNDVPFEEFTARHEVKQLEKQVQVTRFKFKDKEQHEVTEYTSLGASPHEMSFQEDSLPAKTRWVFEYHAGSRFMKEFVQAFYLTGEFMPFRLPPQYTSMLQETQTAVDTTTRFIQGQLAALNYQLAEAKQMQASMFLLSQKLSDRQERKKRRQEFVGDLLSWLPLLLLMKQ